MSFNGDFNNVSIQFKGSALTVALKNWEVLALVTILNFMYAMKVTSPSVTRFMAMIMRMIRMVSFGCIGDRLHWEKR